MRNRQRSAGQGGALLRGGAAQGPELPAQRQVQDRHRRLRESAEVHQESIYLLSRRTPLHPQTGPHVSQVRTGQGCDQGHGAGSVFGARLSAALEGTAALALPRAHGVHGQRQGSRAVHLEDPARGNAEGQGPTLRPLGEQSAVHRRLLGSGQTGRQHKNAGVEAEGTVRVLPEDQVGGELLREDLLRPGARPEGNHDGNRLGGADQLQDRAPAGGEGGPGEPEDRNQHVGAERGGQATAVREAGVFPGSDLPGNGGEREAVGPVQEDQAGHREELEEGGGAGEQAEGQATARVLARQQREDPGLLRGPALPVQVPRGNHQVSDEDVRQERANFAAGQVPPLASLLRNQALGVRGAEGREAEFGAGADRTRSGLPKQGRGEGAERGGGSHLQDQAQRPAEGDKHSPAENWSIEQAGPVLMMINMIFIV